MPIFEYVCQSCGCKFEKLVLSSRRKTSLQCPQCGGQEVKKALSVCGAVSNSASSGAAGAAPGCGPSG
jgi:putative FmdB family regulatory protein